LEAKYAGNGKGSKSKKGKKRNVEDEDDEADGMPSEEAFQKEAARFEDSKAAAGGETSGGRKVKRTKR
jgi:DnaJ family protein C protein 9